MLEIIKFAIALHQRGWISDEDYRTRVRTGVTPSWLGDHVIWIVETYRNDNWVHSGSYGAAEDAFTQFLRESIRPVFTEQPFHNEELIMQLVRSGPLPKWIEDAVKLLVAGDPVLTDALRDALRC